MEIQILFDNETIDKKLSIGWGFSCLVDNHILFDTGESPEYLFANIDIMGIDIDKIEAVVISHDHWDHTGGLYEVLNRKKGLKVYSCPNFSPEFKDKVRALHGILVELEKFSEIAKDIFVTGEIHGVYNDQDMPEQALITKTENGITVITGCAHPGIVEMVEKVKNIFPMEEIHLVLGGFHLYDKDKRAIDIVVERLMEMNVNRVGPTHCSGKEAKKIFKEAYKNHCLQLSAGQKINV